MKSIIIPADVPPKAHATYCTHYHAITKKTHNLFLFAADHKIEHLHQDFMLESTTPEMQDPQYLFKLAAQHDIGAFATQLGLIMRYGLVYPNIQYIAKLNSKTNLVPTEQQEPYSAMLWSVDDVMQIKKETNLNIAGIGATIYLGSEFEAAMLANAAQAVMQAHQHGLIAILWVYPRGKSVENKSTRELLAGAAGVANALGADFVKLNLPATISLEEQVSIIQTAVYAAGNSAVICSGGSHKDAAALLHAVKQQLAAGAQGCAIGRNIFQRPFQDAVGSPI